jgi:hypothetical protein
MAIIDFPSNPTNGQTYNQNGVSYYYNAAIGAWLTQITSTELAATAANNQVLFVDGGLSNGTSGLVYTKAANTLFANGVVANTMVTDRLHVSSISGVGLNPTNNAIVAAFDRANNSLQNTSFTLNGDLTVSGTVNTNININATRLRSNIIQSSTGTDFIIDGYPRMPGQIIQVVNTYLTSPTSQSISAGYNVYNDLSGFAATITPRSASSKIYMTVRWFGEFGDQSQNYNTMWNIKRNGTLLGQPPQPGTLTIGIHMTAISYWANDGDSTPETCFFDYYDTPATTSPVTYQVSIACPNAYTLYTNRCVNATTSGGYERGTSSITLFEIS